MRLPFPERIPLIPAFLFAILLCIIQQYEGTNPTFSLGCFFFILLATLAFNVAGGFARTSGVYIFFYSILVVLIGLCWKAILGEPAESNLLDPLLTIQVDVCGMAMMLVAAFISRKITTKRAILATAVNDANMQTATVGCMITGILVLFASLFSASGGNGSVLSALNQVNRFFPMAIILGVIHTIRRSGGTRSVNLPVVVSGLLWFGFGLFGFSKEGIITPFVCWLMAAASQRYRVSRPQLLGGALAVFFIFHYLVPYSQYGRAYRGESVSENVDVAIFMLSNLGYVREQYLESAIDQEAEAKYTYYNSPQGFFDRLQMLSIDDALIDHTERFGPIGYWPMIYGVQNLVPHFIWKDKPVFLLGNLYAHEINLLGDEDETTGVSFSPTAEAYHLGEWTGIFLLAPVLWILLFALFDSLCGDARVTPWGLLVMVTYSHLASEGGLSAVVYAFGYTTVGILFAAVVGAYIMPVVGTFLIGPEGIVLRRGATIQSVPRRVLRPAPSEN